MTDEMNATATPAKKRGRKPKAPWQVATIEQTQDVLSAMRPAMLSNAILLSNAQAAEFNFRDEHPELSKIERDLEVAQQATHSLNLIAEPWLTRLAALDRAAWEDFTEHLALDVNEATDNT